MSDMLRREALHESQYHYFKVLLLTTVMAANACSMNERILKDEHSSQPLQISATISKTKIKVEKPVEIGCVITNVSSKTVTIRPTRYVFANDYVRFFDSDQMEMDRGFTEEPESILKKESYIELNPGEEFKLSFEAVVRGPNHPNVPDPMKSFHLRMRESSISLRGGHHYSVRCQFEQDKDELDTGSTFGVENIWLGRIISDPIEIEIEE